MPFIKNAYLLLYLINTAKICCVKKVLSDFTIVIREIEIKLQEEKNKHCCRFFRILLDYVFHVSKFSYNLVTLSVDTHKQSC